MTGTSWVRAGISRLWYAEDTECERRPRVSTLGFFVENRPCRYLCRHFSKTSTNAKKKKSPKMLYFQGFSMELMAGFEPATSSLPIIFCLLSFVFPCCSLKLKTPANKGFSGLLVVSCCSLSRPYLNTFLLPLNTSLNTFEYEKAAQDLNPTPSFLCVLCFERVPNRLTGPPNAFFVCVGVHPQSDRCITMAEALRNACHVRAVGYGD